MENFIFCAVLGNKKGRALFEIMSVYFEFYHDETTSFPGDEIDNENEFAKENTAKNLRPCLKRFLEQ